MQQKRCRLPMCLYKKRDEPRQIRTHAHETTYESQTICRMVQFTEVCVYTYEKKIILPQSVCVVHILILSLDSNVYICLFFTFLFFPDAKTYFYYEWTHHNFERNTNRPK